MRTTGNVAVISIFTALIVSSDFALAPYANVKLMDTLVFVAAFVFGFRTGGSVAILSETIWGFISPNGMAGTILPFLVGGELLFAFAGHAAAKLWGDPRTSPFSAQNLFLGAILAICAFVWDFETNAATGLLAGASTIPSLLWYEVPGIPFMVAHELSDFALGALVAPAVIAYSWHMANRKEALGVAKRAGPLRSEE